MNKKGINLRIHFKERMKERYNISVNRELYQTIIDSIENNGQDGLTEFVRKDTNRVSLYKLFIEGKEVFIYFDKRRHELITALPENSKESLENEKGD